MVDFKTPVPVNKSFIPNFLYLFFFIFKLILLGSMFFDTIGFLTKLFLLLEFNL